jgi:hypothetical protein
MLALSETCGICNHKIDTTLQVPVQFPWTEALESKAVTLDLITRPTDVASGARHRKYLLFQMISVLPGIEFLRENLLKLSNRLVFDPSGVGARPKTDGKTGKHCAESCKPCRSARRLVPADHSVLEDPFVTVIRGIGCPGSVNRVWCMLASK